jgi:hypothetical protein
MESLIIAVQVRTHDTISSEGHHEAPIDSKCRMCYKAEEHIKDIVAGCTTLAPSEYTNRHKKVAGQYVNIWGYRLLSSTMNIYLKGS